MKRKPRDPKQDILTNRFKLRILVHGLLLAAGTLGAYIWALNTTDELAVARTVAFSTLALVQLWHTFNVHHDGIIRFNRSLLANNMLNIAVILVIVLQVLAVYTPFLNRILQTAPLASDMLLLSLVMSVIPIVVIQIMNRLNILSK